MEITKIQRSKKSGLKISYLESQTVNGETKTTPRSMSPAFEIHQDLEDAFTCLVPHLVSLVPISPIEIDIDYIRYKKVLKSSDLNQFKVMSLTFTGEGEDEKVEIHGVIILDDERTTPLKALKTALFNTDEYEFSGNLADDVRRVLEETKLYAGGKIKEFLVHGKLELSDKSDDIGTEEDL